jgi:anti-sigma B factor antagonist
MQFEIKQRTENGHHIVMPCGDVDIATQGQLRDAIEELVVAGHVNLVVDLDETTFLDSTGLGALIGARRKAHTFKGSFAIICSDESLLKMFWLTNLDKVFTIQSREEWRAANAPAEASAED